MNPILRNRRSRPLPVSAMLLAACLASSGVRGAEKVRVDPEQLWQQCRVCHSTQEMQRGPILSGLPYAYVTDQLRKFKAGIRGSDPENQSAFLMGSTRDWLPNEREIRRMARYVSKLEPERHLLTVRGDPEKGRVLYQRCLPCHGAKGEGNPLLKGPPVNVQEDWYLLQQMRKFRDGQRGGNPEDAEGLIMQGASQGLTEEDLKHLVRYMAGVLAVKPPLPKPEKPGLE